MTLTLYRVWRFLRYPTRLNLVWAGLAFGLSQLAKFSALILGPLILLLIFLNWLLPAPGRDFTPSLPSQEPSNHSLVWYTRSVLIMFVIGALVIWAGYRFETVPINSLRTISVPAKSICFSSPTRTTFVEEQPAKPNIPTTKI